MLAHPHNPSTGEAKAGGLRVSATAVLRAVTQTYSPSYLRGRNQEDHSLRLAGAKIHKTLISINGWVWWYAPIIPSCIGKHK
jgi:hypothetical protein